ncbi:hypothetical protein BUALT_Bualt02G0069600 [Buddleja alternifolia]|uniref:PWI domain-containing protein n=1 Tax=Buddleja alternifolia TaxID=168488 RepID=A0AAV6Y4U4_9LAMI|nr:hypothetical protein BUALT_Bualt02G0069600 [Buddleja alternifolia]
MSGGFFRGTSADQDTRFSNKQAKLLKSQKFAPELENLVDMTKVKMDVMRPWIAKRVTELIGFEDEVLINFIYGLLEGKAVNGKQIQISLTGFMERNTGKFMKELWALLLSAQQNMSGVPQQFLDAKEEETKNKKDGDGAKYAGLELDVKHDGRDSSIHPADEKERHKRNGLGRHDSYLSWNNVNVELGYEDKPPDEILSSQSPDSTYYSPSPRRKLSASPSKSSNSRSHSERRSRFTSRAPPSKSRSISSEGRRRSPPRRSVTPRRRPSIRRSPSPWRRSLHSRRRSTSGSRRRSPSPVRYRVRSPQRYRSRSPLLRRSRSPMRRRSRTPMRFRSRSPIRRRSPSPMQGRSPSPTRGRSPSPVRRRSPAPLRRRSPSPVRRRSPPPLRRRSPSPLRRRSPSPSRRQSPSPARRRYRRAPSTPRQQSISPVRRRSSMHGRKRSFTPVRRRSLSPQESSSPSQARPSSLSPVGRASLKSARSPTKFPGERVRSHEKYTPARRASPNERTELAKDREGSTAVERRPVVSLRSPQRDMLARSNLRGKERHLSPIQKSPSVSDASLDKSYSEERRSTSPRRSPYQRRERMVRPESPSDLPKTAGPKPRRHSSGTGDDDENLFTRNRSSAKISPVPVRHKDTLDSAEIGGRAGSTKSRKIQPPNSERLPDRVDHKEHHEQEEFSTTRKTTDMGEKGRESYVDAGDRDKEKHKARVDDSKDGHRFPELEAVPKLSRKSEQNDQNGSLVSPSKQTDEPRTKVKEKRKHKKSDRQEVESDDISSYDSYEERKESKRRRKEEKKLKKEERRRRREERRRRRDERHAEKLKSKSVDSGSSSSDLGREHSEDESVKRRESRVSNIQETETERKKLEIELREKALKSLRAKKGIDN